MAIGPVTSPSTWLVGTVVAPSWLQNIHDNSNYFYTGTGASGANLYYWVQPFAMLPSSDWGIVNVSGVPYARKATVGSNILLCPLNLAGNGNANFQQVTEIAVAISAGGSGTVQCALLSAGGLGTGPSISNVSTVFSSGAGNQLVTIGPLTANPSASALMYVEIVSAQANDTVYGVRVKIG